MIKKLKELLNKTKEKSDEINLKNLIFQYTIKNTITAVVAVLLVGIAVFFIAIALLDRNIYQFMNQNITNEIDVSINRETSHLAERFDEVTKSMTYLQTQLQLFYDQYDHIQPPENIPTFGVASNGVYYKTIDNGGSSLYYSSDTTMDAYAKHKALITEALDPIFRSMTNENPLITQTYLNTWDNMNRLYPFMTDAPGQYGPTLKMTDYNFYYLADAAHDPNRTPVWTDSYLDPAGQGWMVSCIVPVYKGNFLEGVAGADVTLSVLIGQLLESPLPVTSTILLTNTAGDIIAMNQVGEEVLGIQELKEYEYTTSIDYTIYKPDTYNLQTQQEGSIGNQVYNQLNQDINGLYLKTEDTRYLTYNKAINGTDWRFVVLTDEKVINEQYTLVQQLIGGIIFTTGITIIFILAGAIVATIIRSGKISQTIADPIQKLQAATAALGSSFQKVHLDQHLHIKEIRSLVDQYNTMATELDTRTQALIEKEAERLYQEEKAIRYEQESITDALTSIFNRRKLDDALDLEIERAKRSGDNLSIILIDIDNFKLVNDGFGHQVGDEVLIEFSKLLLKHTRKTDIVGRWGGEEFLIICPYTTAENAAVLAEHIRIAIAEHGFGPSGNQTASFGVAQFTFDDKKSFFEKVDMAMYKAKHQDKNQVVISQEEPKQPDPSIDPREYN